ncbi:hypothetical protein PIB30_096949, partial [Stylosanthes scabra]|nr:hypothetical protein [Stylosanthes scabra]
MLRSNPNPDLLDFDSEIERTLRRARQVRRRIEFENSLRSQTKNLATEETFVQSSYFDSKSDFEIPFSPTYAADLRLRVEGQKSYRRSFYSTVIPPVPFEINEASSLFPHFKETLIQSRPLLQPPPPPRSVTHTPPNLADDAVLISVAASRRQGSVEGPQHSQFVVAVLGNGGFDPTSTAAASPAPSPASSLYVSSLSLSRRLSLSRTRSSFPPALRPAVVSSTTSHRVVQYPVSSHRALQCLATTSSGFQARLQSAATASQPRKFEHPRHGSLGFLPRKRAACHRGK